MPFSPTPDPTFTFTILVEAADGTKTVEQVPTYGTLADGYASLLGERAVSVRSVFSHAAQSGLVAFADGSRYGA